MYFTGGLEDTPEDEKFSKIELDNGIIVTGDRFKYIIRDLLIEWGTFKDAYDKTINYDNILDQAIKILNLKKSEDYKKNLIKTLDHIYKLPANVHIATLVKQFMLYEPVSEAIQYLFITIKQHFEKIVKLFIDERNKYITEKGLDDKLNDLPSLMERWEELNEEYGYDTSSLLLFFLNPPKKKKVTIIESDNVEKTSEDQYYSDSNDDAVNNKNDVAINEIKLDEEKMSSSDTLEKEIKKLKQDDDYEEYEIDLSGANIEFDVKGLEELTENLKKAIMQFTYPGFCPKVPHTRLLRLLTFPIIEFKELINKFNPSINFHDYNKINKDIHDIIDKKPKKPQIEDNIKRETPPDELQKVTSIEKNNLDKVINVIKWYIDHILQLRKLLIKDGKKYEDYYMEMANIIKKITEVIKKELDKLD